jgi:hypothetical protein
LTFEMLIPPEDEELELEEPEEATAVLTALATSAELALAGSTLAGQGAVMPLILQLYTPFWS